MEEKSKIDGNMKSQDNSSERIGWEGVWEKKSSESNAHEFESWLCYVTLNKPLRLFPYLNNEDKATHHSKPF